MEDKFGSYIGTHPTQTVIELSFIPKAILFGKYVQSMDSGHYYYDDNAAMNEVRLIMNGQSFSYDGGYIKLEGNKIIASGDYAFNGKSNVFNYIAFR